MKLKFSLKKFQKSEVGWVLKIKKQEHKKWIQKNYTEKY